MTNYTIKRITREECKPFILDIHYAGRFPSVSYAYGLFSNEELVGIVTYGTPPSPPLRNGIAGKEFSKNILELNRLCLKFNKKNEASMLVGKSLKLLKLDAGDSIIVSFADTEQDHKGIVYQATNFDYYGLSAKRKDWKVKGMEHKHGISIADEFRHLKTGRADAMRKKYGNDFYSVDRPRKHRYITIIGSKAFKKLAKKSIKYKQQDYPK